MIVETREPEIGFLVKGGPGASGLRVGWPRPIFRGLASQGPMMGGEHTEKIINERLVLKIRLRGEAFRGGAMGGLGKIAVWA